MFACQDNFDFVCSITPEFEKIIIPHACFQCGLLHYKSLTSKNTP